MVNPPTFAMTGVRRPMRRAMPPQVPHGVRQPPGREPHAVEQRPFFRPAAQPGPGVPLPGRRHDGPHRDAPEAEVGEARKGESVLVEPGRQAEGAALPKARNLGFQPGVGDPISPRLETPRQFHGESPLAQVVGGLGRETKQRGTENALVQTHDFSLLGQRMEDYPPAAARRDLTPRSRTDFTPASSIFFRSSRFIAAAAPGPR